MDADSSNGYIAIIDRRRVVICPLSFCCVLHSLNFDWRDFHRENASVCVRLRVSVPRWGAASNNYSPYPVSELSDATSDLYKTALQPYRSMCSRIVKGAEYFEGCEGLATLLRDRIVLVKWLVTRFLPFLIVSNCF